MKNWTYNIRVNVIFIVGLQLVGKTYQFKYSTNMFNLKFYGGLIIIGLAILIWSLLTDLKHYLSEKKIVSLIPILIAVVFATTIWVWNAQINSNFNKPTLVRILYHGDLNRIEIDFKTDGTYIYDNSAIGINNYTYGEYEINGNVITLDRNNLNNVHTNRLEIRSKPLEYSAQTESEKCVYQIDENGNVKENATVFGLVIDNRGNHP